MTLVSHDWKDLQSATGETHNLSKSGAEQECRGETLQDLPAARGQTHMEVVSKSNGLHSDTVLTCGTYWLHEGHTEERW